MQITVVVPAWDLGTELVESIESVVSQNVAARVLIVDNASTRKLPDTPSECLRLRERVSVGLARNAGLAQVITKYVFFMDGDDVLLPGALGHLLDALEADANLVAAAGSIVLWDPVTGRRAPSYYPPAWAFRLHKYASLFALANVAVNTFPAVGSTLVRTEIARAVGGFPDSNFLETWAFGVSITSRGPVRLSARPCKLYRVGPSRSSLKRTGIGDWRSSGSGRREVRRRYSRARPRSPAARLLLPVVVAGHTLQAFAEARRVEPRYAKFLRGERG